MLEIGLHVQELEPQHLGVSDDRIGAAMPEGNGFVDQIVGLRRLLGDGVDGVLEDLAFAAGL